MKLFNKKTFSVMIIILIYILAFLFAYYSFKYIPLVNLILKFLVSDIIATIVVFLGSAICKNASIYSPYWSIAPMVMAPFMAYHTTGFHFFNILILIVIELWGGRLTINWLIRFKNLKEQDWRYTHFQNKHPKLYPLILLFGIHIMPTLIVFLGMLPVLAYMDAFSSMNLENANLTILFSAIVSILAICIEAIADVQMNQFKKDKNNIGTINERGLWKISRHPNYFGEILFWFSLFLFSLSVRSDMWVLVFCPLVIFLLFGCITIPLLEKRELVNKSNYVEYKKRTNLLLPIFPPDPKVVEERERRKNKRSK